MTDVPAHRRQAGARRVAGTRYLHSDGELRDEPERVRPASRRVAASTIRPGSPADDTQEG